MVERQITRTALEAADQPELPGEFSRRRSMLFGKMLDGGLQCVGLAQAQAFAECAKQGVGAVVEADGDGAQGEPRSIVYYTS